MSHYIHIERISQTPIPIGRRYALCIVVRKPLQPLTLNRREFANTGFFLDERRQRTADT